MRVLYVANVWTIEQSHEKRLNKALVRSTHQHITSFVPPYVMMSAVRMRLRRRWRSAPRADRRWPPSCGDREAAHALRGPPPGRRPGGLGAARVVPGRLRRLERLLLLSCSVVACSVLLFVRLISVYFLFITPAISQAAADVVREDGRLWCVQGDLGEVTSSQ